MKEKKIEGSASSQQESMHRDHSTLVHASTKEIGRPTRASILSVRKKQDTDRAVMNEKEDSDDELKRNGIVISVLTRYCVKESKAEEAFMSFF